MITETGTETLTQKREDQQTERLTNKSYGFKDRQTDCQTDKQIMDGKADARTDT